VTLVAAFSSGKDSTAMAIRLRAKYLFFTPTGNELPPVAEHIERVRAMLGAELIIPPGPSLASTIELFQCLPNWQKRFCTRLIKIKPAMAWMHEHPDAIMAVGLRADEETREGIYGLPDERYKFPLREAGWGLEEVLKCCEDHNVAIPTRTDCAVCFFQRLGEWWQLWRDWPDYWQQGEAWEDKIGHTFRSPSRDTWPASMRGLRERFERGDKPRGADDVHARERRCRVCTL